MTILSSFRASERLGLKRWQYGDPRELDHDDQQLAVLCLSRLSGRAVPHPHPSPGGRLRLFVQPRLDRVHELHDRLSRRGKNTQFPLADLLRQSVYSRLVGSEDLNDAERLSQDPTFRPMQTPGENGAKLGTEWLLSRRDRLIVARHEVPGYRRKAAPSRRDGRSHCQSQCQQNRFNRPAGTGPFSS